MTTWKKCFILSDERGIFMVNKEFLLIVSTDIEGAVEDEFNDWYNVEHIPKLVKVPGVLSARRYMALEGKPKYFTVYHHENEYVRSKDEYKQILQTEWATKISPYLKNFRKVFLKRI
jgi:hypothetical protein